MTNLREKIRELTTLLRTEPNPGDRAEFTADVRQLQADANTWLGELYTYGLPGSDPNVEQLADGRLRITLLQPLLSGQEKIETLFMRPPTVADILSAGEARERAGGNESTAMLTKLAACLRTEAGRPLTVGEMKGLLEEECDMLVGANGFLASRFRRTRKVFGTS